MPKILCKCGEVLNLNLIPNPIEWRIISDIEMEDLSVKLNKFDLELKMKVVVECSKCRGLWIKWTDTGDYAFYKKDD